MRFSRLQRLLIPAFLVLSLSSCGVDEYLVAVQVLPQNATAITGSIAGSVQFTAIGWYAPLQACGYGDCGLDKPNKRVTLTNAKWATSDPLHTTVDSTGLATCLGPSLTPATITATASGGQFGPISGSAILVCE